MTDKRRLNQVWKFTNPQGDKYIYGRVGSGKNEIIVTLDYCDNEFVQNKKLAQRELQVGLMWKNIKNGQVPKIKKCR